MPKTVRFYESERGDKPVGEFLNSLSIKAKAKCVAYLKKLEEHDRLPASIAVHVEDEIWEVRPEFGGTEHRFFYFTLVGDTLYVVHAVKKKQQKAKRSDIDLAKKRAQELRDRLKAEPAKEKNS